jgi:hypothetical protein
LYYRSIAPSCLLAQNHTVDPKRQGKKNKKKKNKKLHRQAPLTLGDFLELNRGDRGDFFLASFSEATTYALKSSSHKSAGFGLSILIPEGLIRLNAKDSV